MIRPIVRILSFLVILGCLYWIKTEPRNIEPYVTLVGSIVAFVGTLIGAPKANVVPSLILNGRNVNFRIHNVGEADAHDVRVEFNGHSPLHQRELDAFPTKDDSNEDPVPLTRLSRIPPPLEVASRVLTPTTIQRQKVCGIRRIVCQTTGFSCWRALSDNRPSCSW
jgi:hypothetical protein